MPQPAPGAPAGGREPLTITELIRMVQLTSARHDAQTIVDRLLDSPEATHALMDQFLVRVATEHMLEDARYQPAVDSLATAYRMIGRITDGDFTLPAVVA